MIRKTMITIVLIFALITPSLGALVTYESNQATDTFEVLKPVTITPNEIWLPDDWNPIITLTNRASNQISGTRSTNISIVFFVNQTEDHRHELGFSPIYTDYTIPAESEQSWNLPYNHGINVAMKQWQDWCQHAEYYIKVLLHLEVTNP